MIDKNPANYIYVEEVVKLWTNTIVKTAKSDNFPELISDLFIFEPKLNSIHLCKIFLFSFYPNEYLLLITNEKYFIIKTS